MTEQLNWTGLNPFWGFLGGASGKNSPANAGYMRCGFKSWVGKIPWRRECQLTPVFLPGKSQEQRTLAVYSPGIIKSWTQLNRHALKDKLVVSKFWEF